MKKIILSGAVGLVVGGAVGFIFGKTVAGKKFDEELEATRRYYKGKSEKKEKNAVAEVKEAAEPVKPMPVTSKTSIDFTNNKSKSHDISKYTKTKESFAPYPITPEDWDKNEKVYNKEWLIYYEDDDVLADNDDRIWGIAENIGRDNLENHMGEFEEETLYVCNDRIGTLFCVSWTKDSYEETTGISPAEAEEMVGHE